MLGKIPRELGGRKAGKGGAQGDEGGLRRGSQRGESRLVGDKRGESAALCGLLCVCHLEWYKL